MIGVLLLLLGTLEGSTGHSPPDRPLPAPACGPRTASTKPCPWSVPTCRSSCSAGSSRAIEIILPSVRVQILLIPVRVRR